MIRIEEAFLGAAFFIVCALAGWVAGGIHYGVVP